MAARRLDRDFFPLRITPAVGRPERWARHRSGGEPPPFAIRLEHGAIGSPVAYFVGLLQRLDSGGDQAAAVAMGGIGCANSNVVHAVERCLRGIFPADDS